MIRINLLGDETALDYSNRYLVFLLLSLLAIFSVVAFRLYSSTGSEIRQLKIKSGNLTLELNRLEERTKIVKEYEKKKRSLQMKLVHLAKLRRNKIGPVRLLDDLNKAVPDRVWIREFTEKNGVLKILGRALDNQDIALFIKQLQESDYVNTVDLIESRQVYYSKKTGQIGATPDVTPRGQAGGTESRVTKKDAFAVRGQDQETRSRVISENNIKIKEFSLEARINYGGKLRAESVIAETESAAEDEFESMDF